MSTGWTLEHVGWNLDLPRLVSLNKYWEKFPPVHVLVAKFVGYKQEDKQPVNSELSLDELMAQAPKFNFVPPVMKNGNDR